MKCARHPYEGGAGVCAPCLRARLLALAAAQNEASSLPPLPLPPPPEPEPELVFPRSVSPYVCRRKSDASAAAARGRSPLLFFRTPQVGPAYGGGTGLGEGDIGFRRRRSGRFSVLAALFGHRSEEKEKDSSVVDKERRRRPSWLGFGIGRRKKEQATASSPPPRRSWHEVSDQGLSPVRYACGDGDESGACPAAESPWLPSPSPMRKTPCRRRSLGLGLGGPSAGVSGFAVCISPLVRPGLLGSRHLRGGHPPDAVSNELRPSPLHPLTSSASLHHCRSWKLADGGRFR
ncbi:hypothetical protein HU200_063256 [Digitaria exilis]|uniref:Uncharacterized protein n=1 Tax=Digitaria exilis TaxID=1010633 RepID=A0A835A201_9POAL|nr:hypothetical protein HU200_063256 [Digitaria exilis]